MLMKRFLMFTLTLLFATTSPVFSDTDSRYGDIITYVYAYADAHDLRYTGADVKAFQSLYLANYHEREDVSYTWRFRLSIHEVEDEDDRELGAVISKTEVDGGGGVQDGNAIDAYRYMSVSAHLLQAGTEYGMKAYTRLTVTGRVKKNGRTVKRTEEWFVEPKGFFRAR